jgi:alpha-L-fucosidase
MKLFFYFSMMDWHSPLYRPSLKEGTPVSQEFLDFMHGQVRELCTNYGKLGAMWFDGDWLHTPDQWQADKLVRMIRELQPDALINNRLGRYNPERNPAWDLDRMGDFSCPEMSFRDLPADPDRAWEFNSTINDNWAYAKTDTRFKSSNRLVQLMVMSVAHGGNYLLNISPLPSGKMVPEMVDRLRKVGQWLNRNGESIYGAEPFRPLYFDNCYTTKKGNKVYLHLFDWAPGASCDLWTLELKDAERAYFLETGAKVEFTRSHAHYGLRLRVRNNNPEPSPDTVIVFEGAIPV